MKWSFLLVLALCAQLVWAQPIPQNLMMPVNHAGTGIAHDLGYDWGQPYNLYVFDAKSQPHRIVGGGQENQHAYLRLKFQPVPNPLEILYMSPGPYTYMYPAYVYRGATLEGGEQQSYMELQAASYKGIGPNLVNGYAHAWGAASWNPTFWYTYERESRVTAVCTPSATPDCGWPPPEPECSQYYIVGLDWIGDPQPDAKIVYHNHGGNISQGWWRVLPTDQLAPNVLGGLAIYDIEAQSFDDDWQLATFGVVAVTTTALNPVSPGQSPLVNGPVITYRVHWVPYAELGLWEELNPAPGRTLLNLQIALSVNEVYGVALDAAREEFLTFRGDYVDQDIRDGSWTQVASVTNVPDGAVPYDIAIINGPELGLLTATSKGVYFSQDGGLHWGNAGNGLGDTLRVPEFRKLSVWRFDWHHVAAAGWYASYYGEIDDNWNFTWHEINYTPTLYQHWDRAWSCVRANEPEDSINVALIDHSTDPIFPEPEPVVVQVQQFNRVPKTVFLGKQDETTHGFLRLNKALNEPWIVYNPLGEAGPMVRRALPPGYLDWDSTILIETENTPIPISDVSSSPAGNFIMFDNRPLSTNEQQLWRDLGNGWESALCEGLGEGSYWGNIAVSDRDLYYLVNADGNRYLYRSSDYGDWFSLVAAEAPPHWFDTDIRNISVGWREDMPVYLGGGTFEGGDGYIFLWDPTANTWTEGLWDNDAVTQIVADPYCRDVFFAACRHVNGDVPLFQLGTYLGGEPAVFGRAGLWKPIPIVEQENFAVMDIQVVPTSEHGREVYLTLRTPNSNAQGIDHTVVKRWQLNIWAPDVPTPASLGGQWIVAGEVTVPSEQTLTVEPGTSLQFLPGAKLIVEGTLHAEGTLGEEIVFGKVAPDQSGPWEGIYVEGTCELSYCTIEGAATGVKSVKGADLVLTSCVIQNNETGLDLYAPGGTGNPEINGCTVVDNQGNGMVLTGTESATIIQCQINHNGEDGEDGVLLIDSYAELTENQIRENGGYGLKCLGSSPVLYCNNFQNNGAGEMGLFKESYPVLWDKAQGVGANSFMNDTQTLIKMESSAPVVAEGWNDFYVGPYGFFMADLSEKPVKHDLTNNYWNPELRLELLYPSDPNVWTWGGVAESPSNCGTPKGELMGLAGLLFEEGLEAEMSGDLALAHTKYAQLVTLYPDSAWSLPAAARLFETQRHLDSAYTTLQAFYDTVASSHPEDTLLANAARALATRLWVEDGQYDPALFAYQQVIQNPPSSMDSVYAALDYSVTALRAQIEDRGGTLDSYSPSVSAASIRHLVGLVRTTLPIVPPTQHEGYSLPPSNFVLAQNYPNPFNALTTIRYYLPEASRVTLDVYNITGQHIATLTDGLESSGYHVVHWNASSVASGVYVYQIQAGSFVDSKKMVLIR